MYLVKIVKYKNIVGFVYLYRSLVWYQCNYFNFINMSIIKLLFISAVLTFFVIDINLVVCANSILTKVMVGGHEVHVFGNICHKRLFQKIISISQQQSYIFELIKYHYLDGRIVPRHHPWYHPHIYITFKGDVYSDILINIQLTTNNYLGICQSITELLLSGHEENQLAKINFTAIESKSLIQDFKAYQQCNNYTIKHYKNIYDFTKLICNKHLNK